MKNHYTYHFSLVVNTGEYLVPGVPGTWFRDYHSLIPSMGIPKNLPSDGMGSFISKTCGDENGFDLPSPVHLTRLK